jgi:hypothetical protein
LIFFLYYKSEKSSGSSSIVAFPEESISISVDELVQRTLSHKPFICLNILSGLEYLETSKPRSPASLGNI